MAIYLYLFALVSVCPCSFTYDADLFTLETSSAFHALPLVFLPFLVTRSQGFLLFPPPSFLYCLGPSRLWWPRTRCLVFSPSLTPSIIDSLRPMRPVRTTRRRRLVSSSMPHMLLWSVCAQKKSEHGGRPRLLIILARTPSHFPRQFCLHKTRLITPEGMAKTNRCLSARDLLFHTE